MKSPEQRRSPRYLTDWSAQYRLDPDDEWRACLVLDVSLDGAALELSDTALVGVSGCCTCRSRPWPTTSPASSSVQ